MIEISPAILTNDLEKFKLLVSKYVEAKFTTVDIDFAESRFVMHDTLPIETVLPLVKDYKHVNWGWHLMLSEPRVALVKALNFMKDNDLQGRVYVHQEADIHFIKDYDPMLQNIGVAVKTDTLIKKVEFYNRFPEVQLMSVVSGSQGGKFDSSIVEKIQELRESGYVGKISLDGGINLAIAKHLREFDINRVSVGSYFQESENLELDWHKLNLALNL